MNLEGALYFWFQDPTEKIRKYRAPSTFIHYNAYTVFAVHIIDRNIGCVWPRNIDGLGTKTTGTRHLKGHIAFVRAICAIQSSWKGLVWKEYDGKYNVLKVA